MSACLLLASTGGDCKFPASKSSLKPNSIREKSEQ